MTWSSRSGSTSAGRASRAPVDLDDRGVRRRAVRIRTPEKSTPTTSCRDLRRPPRAVPGLPGRGRRDRTGRRTARRGALGGQHRQVLGRHRRRPGVHRGDRARGARRQRRRRGRASRRCGTAPRAAGPAWSSSPRWAPGSDRRWCTTACSSPTPSSATSRSTGTTRGVPGGEQRPGARGPVLAPLGRGSRPTTARWSGSSRPSCSSSAAG